jgi:hypothetical protein
MFLGGIKVIAHLKMSSDNILNTADSATSVIESKMIHEKNLSLHFGIYQDYYFRSYHMPTELRFNRNYIIYYHNWTMITLTGLSCNNVCSRLITQ